MQNSQLFQIALFREPCPCKSPVCVECIIRSHVEYSFMEFESRLVIDCFKIRYSKTLTCDVQRIMEDLMEKSFVQRYAMQRVLHDDKSQIVIHIEYY